LTVAVVTTVTFVMMFLIAVMSIMWRAKMYLQQNLWPANMKWLMCRQRLCT